MKLYDRIEELGVQYNKSLQNCMHASFLLASELLVPEQHNIILCIFRYGKRSHMVVIKDKLYFDLWVGAIINRKYIIEHKFSFFNEDRFNKFYVANNPKNINFINVGSVNEYSGN